MATHRLSKEDMKERDEKILKMAEIGADYRDIGKRYGISSYRVYEIVRKHDKTRGIKARFGSSNNTGRACFCIG